MESFRIKSANHIMNYCGNLSKKDKVLFIFDDSTKDVLPYLIKAIDKVVHNIQKIKIPIMQNHGEEPPTNVAQSMKNSTLIVALTKMSLAHTKARLKACNFGARYLSLAEYSCKILENEAILGVDRNIEHKLNKLEKLFNLGKKVEINTALGTKLNLDISTRTANNCPGYVTQSGDLGSPPDMEVNISPLENMSNGRIVIDGSITHPKIGLLENPVILEIKNGSIIKYSNNYEGKLIKDIMTSCKNNKVFILAELGVGFNPRAKLNGTMLIDEGAAGCIHFGFGSNSTVGGINDVSFHLDFVMKKANLYLDEELIIQNGNLLI